MRQRFLNFGKIRQQTIELFDENAWRPGREISKLRRFLHFWILVWTSFSRNRCPVRAASLAYAALLALIPMLAVVVAVTSSFLKTEGETSIDQFIVKFVASVTPRAMVNTNVVAAMTNMTVKAAGTNTEVLAGSGNETNSTAAASPGQTNHKFMPTPAQEQEALRARQAITRRIHQFIQNTRSGTLGVTGSVALIFVAISMLSQIENMFNDIWGVAHGRGWFMRIVLYWTVITLAPLLIVVAVGLTTGPHWDATRRLLTITPVLGNLFFELLPIVLLCLGLSLFYRLMPNTKVHWDAALVGGLVGGILWHLNSLVSVLYVSRVVSYSQIYGGLGLVPVFMIGLYFSWWILLFGAQVAYAFQNRASYLEQKQVENIDQRGREIIAFRLMAWIGRRFLRGQAPPTVFEMGHELGLPTRLIQQLMQTLAAAGLTSEISGHEPAYLPGRPLERITCCDILMAVRAGRGGQLAARQELAASRIYETFRRLESIEQQAASAITLRDLAEISKAGLRNLEPQEQPANGEHGKSSTEQQTLAE